MIIKVLLLLAFAALAFTATRATPSPGHLAVRRLLIVGLLVAAAVAVLFPDLVTELARSVGVGRGTDLVLYAMVVVTAMIWIGVYRRIIETESRLAELVRSQALAAATSGPAGDVEHGQP